MSKYGDLGETHVARIIGVDPGKASGVGILDLFYCPAKKPDSKSLLRNFRVTLYCAMTIPLEGHAKTLRVILQDAADGLPVPLVIANEKYVVTRLTQQSQDTQALEVSQTVQAVLELLDIPHTYVDQLPSAAKMLVTDERLRLMGFDIHKFDGHARDAIRHAVTWAVGYVHAKVNF